MRTECKHFESRTYRNGETVRKCDLDLAPDAPWRCPDDCPKYERRLADRSWTYGTLVTPPTPAEPASVADGSAARILDEAEDHLNEIGAQVKAEVEEELAEPVPAAGGAASSAAADRLRCERGSSTFGDRVAHSPRAIRTSRRTSGRSVMMPSTPMSSSSWIRCGSSTVHDVDTDADAMGVIGPGARRRSAPTRAAPARGRTGRWRTGATAEFRRVTRRSAP